MPNVLDVEPVRAFAARAADLIANAAISARYERLAFGHMLEDERNFRPATLTEVRRALPWAQEAHARGELLSVFRMHPSAARHVRMVARRIASTCALAALDRARFAAHAAGIGEAAVFLGKISRADFATTSRKALRFSRLYAIIEDELACETPAAEIAATSARVWRRVRTVSELHQVGREFLNCLARTPRCASYGAMLTRRTGEFWVLRDAAGLGLIVALARLPAPVRFTEVRGPRNAAISHDHEDLALLGRALGVEPRPSPPPSMPDAEFEAMLEWLRGREPRFARLRLVARAS